MTMAPAAFEHVVVPPSTFLAPTTDGRAIPPTKPQLRYNLPQPTNGAHQATGPLHHRSRLLTVDEALQYSPLSSIVPFTTDVIPSPDAHLPGSQQIFPSPSERQAARQSLDLVDRTISQHQGQSGFAQMALNNLRPYLDKSVITNFKFKEPAGLTANSSKINAHFKINGYVPNSTQLGAFANMILDATDLAHGYPTPITTQSDSSKRRPFPGSAGKKEPAGNLKPPDLQPLSPVSLTAQQLATQNERSLPLKEQLSANQILPLTPEKLYPIVLITPLPPGTKPDEYVKIPDKEAGIESSQKRNSMVNAETKQQRIISDEAVRRLQELTQELIEADDQLQLDASSDTGIEAARCFISTHHDDRELRTLTPAVQVKLESSLQKVISLGRFRDISPESLCRIQGLCEGALSSVEFSDFHVGLASTSNGESKWIHGVETFDLGLRSTRTILRIMAGDREEKEIYSEELLQTALRVIEKVFKSCIVPIVEARNTGPSSAIFETASTHKKIISQLSYDASKVIGLLVEILSKVEVSESVVTTLEFFAARLLFVENAHSEKESVLGIQKFESLRRTSMDMIAEIFSRYPDQRTFLIDEILTSLQKLPVNRPHARQYKLAEGKSVQLVSALMMRLIQTSANAVAAKRMGGKGDVPNASDSSEEDCAHHGTIDSYSESSDETSEEISSTRHSEAMRRLAKDANRLSDNAAKNAQYVIRFYVQRAITAPKTGDQPHRHLMDMFAEDLIVVLGLPEWPAAELLLRALLIRMIDIAENKKYNAPAKSMALELLGIMGSGISGLVANTQNKASVLENEDSAFGGYLRQLLEEYMDGKLENDELLGWEGPYRAVLEYFEQSGLGDKQIASAQGYILTQWAKSVASGNLKSSVATQNLARRLRKMLSNTKWVTSDETEAVTINQSRLSYALTVLSMDFCRQFDRVLKILLDSISSDQITVRTRSLKSVTQMLEQDPSLLDRARNVKILIMRCATDVSSMVRDSALMLIGKCILLKPALEQEFSKPVLVLTNDSAIGVRKRAIKLLKDIYLRNSLEDSIRAAIADSLLQRVRDLDVGVSDLAIQTFEDIWFSPYWKIVESADLSAQERISLQRQVRLIVGTVQRGETVASVMVTLLEKVLSNTSKSALANLKVCEALVRVAFEDVIDSGQNSERLEQRNLLQTLTVFARANARLFVAEQLKHLLPSINYISESDDFHAFKAVVIIFRCILPHVSKMHHNLLREVQTALMRSISNLGKAELDEVAACLWTINETLNEPEKLIKLTVSVLKNLRILEDVDFEDPQHLQDLRRARKYVRIAGYFGKHCNLESHSQNLRQALSWWKGSSVAGLIISSIFPFTKSKKPLRLRADALDGIGLICQSWPFQFNQQYVSGTFQDVLENGEPELQKIVLSSFRDFFLKQERQAGVKNNEISNTENLPANGKLGGSMTASDGDGASALIAQRFLKSVLRIALASQEVSALTATQVIASINRQGLVHPKESGPALVALETSSNEEIAGVAFQEHRSLHQQHESMFEREYMRAIQEAFKYQRDIVKDSLGTTPNPPTSKLRAMFEIIKTSKGKYQKKFISNFCSKIDFDITKLESLDVMANTLEYSRFLIENLAFFEYPRVDELLHSISCMEKIVAGTGSGIAHTISTEIFRVKVDSMIGSQYDGGQEPQEVAAVSSTDLDLTRLRQLSIAAVILSSLWEARTFLRRLFGLHSTQQRRENKTKHAAKDLNKVPSRVHGISGERFLATISDKVNSLENQDSMLRECKDFVELLSVDNEIKVAADNDEDVAQEETPSGDDERETSIPGSGGSKSLKRKGSVSVVGTPQKKKKARPSVGPRKKGGKSADGESDWD